MRQRHWVAAAGLLFVVLVIGLLAYGIRTHEEATLLHVCWYKGHAIYKDPMKDVQNGPCTQFEELVWPKSQIPLTVTARSYQRPQLRAIEADTIKAVIAAINDDVGFEIIRLVDTSDASVRALLGAPVEVGPSTVTGHAHVYEHRYGALGRAGLQRQLVFDHARGYCVHKRAAGSDRLGAELLLRAGGSHNYLFHLYWHELGHCLGLSHDDFPASVMDPEIMDTGWQADRPMKILRFTDADRKRLQTEYQ